MSPFDLLAKTDPFWWKVQFCLAYWWERIRHPRRVRQRHLIIKELGRAARQYHEDMLIKFFEKQV